MLIQVIGQMPAPGMVVGIDEAGKGCVLGDLVIGAVFWRDEEPPIKGLRDSKVLSAKRRESLFDELKSVCPCVTISIHAHEIKPGNILDLQTAATRMLLRRFRPRRAIIDCPHASPPKFTRLVASPGVSVIAEHKADQRHRLASAGSIVAKVIRDRKLRRMADFLGADLGCGYPGDAKTRAWLESLAGVTDPNASRVVRWGWSTCEDILGPERVASELAEGRQHGEET